MKKLSKLFAVVVLAFFAVAANGQNVEKDSVDWIEQSLEKLPVVSPYFLQHQYLSVVAPDIDEHDGYILETPEILNSISANGNGFQSPFSDSEIEVSVIEDEGKRIYVWHFPEPEFLREAVYMAFIPVDGCYKAYAISIGQLVDWEISTSTESARSTFGRVKKPESAKECVELLKKRGAYTGKITMGEILQDGYTAPEYRK